MSTATMTVFDIRPDLWQNRSCKSYSRKTRTEV